MSCPEGDSGSHGPGHSTNKIVLKAAVSQYGQTSNVTFTCFETSAWGGNCHFDNI